MRSGDCPLSIRLGGGSESVASLRVAQTVARFSERWHDVDFDIPLGCFIRALTGIQLRLPILRSVDLNWERNSIEMFSVAPQLVSQILFQSRGIDQAISLHALQTIGKVSGWSHLSSIYAGNISKVISGGSCRTGATVTLICRFRGLFCA